MEKFRTFILVVLLLGFTSKNFAQWDLGGGISSYYFWGSGFKPFVGPEIRLINDSKEQWNSRYNLKYYFPQSLSYQIKGVKKNPLSPIPTNDYRQGTQTVKLLLSFSYVISRAFEIKWIEGLKFQLGLGVDLTAILVRDYLESGNSAYDYGYIVKQNGGGGLYALIGSTGFLYSKEKVSFYFDFDQVLLRPKFGQLNMPVSTAANLGVVYNIK